MPDRAAKDYAYWRDYVYPLIVRRVGQEAADVTIEAMLDLVQKATA
jgi:hypothetical protein